MTEYLQMAKISIIFMCNEMLQNSLRDWLFHFIYWEHKSDIFVKGQQNSKCPAVLLLIKSIFIYSHNILTLYL